MNIIIFLSQIYGLRAASRFDAGRSAATREIGLDGEADASPAAAVDGGA
jgi:hypothetical protein